MSHKLKLKNICVTLNKIAIIHEFAKREKIKYIVNKRRHKNTKKETIMI